ncbi:hypothetical protein SELMODRAFT_424156 [Selaginella moellendorffii]|uniref:Neprosin PEP catalytic domain-containing protein n=1 Tax=Selaginella moellendorffii TaxID=88036 RepID=D8SP02_SELML|nr:hypothetical protein SELMODRAFT_424156 [Selaginella moellendorffii]
MTPTKIEPRVNGFDPSKNVFVEPAESIQQLFTYFERLERVLNQQQRRERPVRLLLIDSVAASFRSELDNNRTEMVMDCVDGSKGIQIGNLLELVSSGRRIAPALGLSWAHCINTRLFLSRRDEPSSEKLIEAPVKRQKVVNDEGMKQATASINEFQPQCAGMGTVALCQIGNLAPLAHSYWNEVGVVMALKEICHSDLQLSNGDIILCVPIKNQLSLRNQTLQLLSTMDQKIPGQLFGLEVGSCKENTIPVLHTSNTIAARFDSVRKLTKKHSSGKNRVPLADEEPGVETHEHGYNQLNGNFQGMETSINVWEPYVEQTSEFSLSQLWIISNKLGPVNTVEAGWQELGLDSLSTGR